PIAGCADPEIYQAGVLGYWFWYRLAVPPGKYSIKFHFREFDANVHAGDRVFDIQVSTAANPIQRPRTTIISKLDVLGRAGAADRALVVEVPGIDAPE